MANPGMLTQVPALTVKSLSFRYPKQVGLVLRGVSFKVQAGQSLGVLGANGSGKSTLLNAILGVRAGTRLGSVTFHGTADFSRTLVGYATQQISLYQQLTVKENLRHVARMLLSRKAVPAAVDRTLAEFGLTERANVLVRRLSGGWQRLAHLAASFVHDPPLRILDEPTAALDFETRNRLVGLVNDWRQAGSTLLVTSHYPEDIEEMCTHAVVIREGTVARYQSVPAFLAGYRRELVIDTETAYGPQTVRVAAPQTIHDLHQAVADIATGDDMSGRRVIGIRTSQSRLREVLVADPQLQGVVSGED